MGSDTNATLPRASGLDDLVAPDAVDPDVLAHLTHLYGSLAREVVAAARDDPSLLERPSPDGPDIAAQVCCAAKHEWARSVDDVVGRRTTLFYRGLVDDAVVARVGELLSG